MKFTSVSSLLYWRGQRNKAKVIIRETYYNNNKLSIDFSGCKKITFYTD